MTVVTLALLSKPPGDDWDWRHYAACAETDPDAFFPMQGESARAAKRVCAGCEVRDECLQYAMAHHEPYGVWGGLSEWERRLLRWPALRRNVVA